MGERERRARTTSCAPSNIQGQVCRGIHLRAQIIASTRYHIPTVLLHVHTGEKESARASTHTVFEERPRMASTLTRSPQPWTPTPQTWAPNATSYPLPRMVRTRSSATLLTSLVHDDGRETAKMLSAIGLPLVPSRLTGPIRPANTLLLHRLTPVNSFPSPLAICHGCIWIVHALV